MNLDPRSLVLLGLAVLGTGATIAKIWDDWRNVKALRHAITIAQAVRFRARWWIATASLVSSVGQLFVWLGFLGIGLVAVSYPGPPPVERAWRNELILYLLIFMECMLAAVQVWQIAVRAQVRAPRMLIHVGPPPTEGEE